ncbi:unnamed protein product [Paramecium octaurelia]|uniref:Uncharacterized protein n=1 Tax=Paramecium octaurelia TaxID=43137 RepID=A0A8S1UMS0_PAROT|nr:unnamed protein product [Paramecium octaurelia]
MASMLQQTNNNQFEKQIQQFKPQTQAQAQIQYYVYQDLQYVINLLYQMKAVAQHFKNSEHTMVKLCNNKLMLQLNISFGIHLDQLQQSQRNETNFYFLKAQKNNAFMILESIIQKMSDNEKELLKEQLECIQNYMTNCLGPQYNWRQYQLKATNMTPQFNDQVLQQLINSIQQVDNQVTHIKENSNSSFPLEQIERTAQQFERKTQEQLNRNFPNLNNSNFNMQENELSQVDNLNISYPKNQWNKQNNQKTQSTQPDLMNSVDNEFQNQQLTDVLCHYQYSNSNQDRIVQQINLDYEKFKVQRYHQIYNLNCNVLQNYQQQGHLREQFKYFQIFKIYHDYVQQANNNLKQFVEFLLSYQYKDQYHYDEFINYIMESQEIINSKSQYMQGNNSQYPLNPQYYQKLYQKFLLIFQYQKR